MSKNKFHTEAAIVQYLRATLFFMYYAKDGIQVYMRYNCAMAILKHWNTLHKRSRIYFDDVMQLALDAHNTVYETEISLSAAKVQLDKIKSIFSDCKT